MLGPLGAALGNVLPLAVAVAIFPVPIIAAVLIVGSDGGRAKGVGFVLAWAAGLALVGSIALVVAGGTDASDEGEPATWVSALLLVLGLLLLMLAVKQWRDRPTGSEEAPLPSWMKTVDAFTMTRAAGVGFALSGLNPKNALLSVAAAAEIAEVGLPAGRQVVVLLSFVVIASIGVLTPILLALAGGERSRKPLAALRNWMARYNAVIMSVLFLLIGAKLIGDAISGFSG